LANEARDNPRLLEMTCLQVTDYTPLKDLVLAELTGKVREGKHDKIHYTHDSQMSAW
jgi:hypothetical protein